MSLVETLVYLGYVVDIDKDEVAMPLITYSSTGWKFEIVRYSISKDADLILSII